MSIATIFISCSGSKTVATNNTNPRLSIVRVNVTDLFEELEKIEKHNSIQYQDTANWSKIPLRDNENNVLYQYITMHKTKEFTIVTTVTKRVNSRVCEVKTTRIINN